MSENGARRRPRVLSPEAKWEIFLEVTSRETTQAEAARPGRRAKERNWELEQAQREVAQLTEAVKSQAIELALLRGKAGWA